MCYIIRGISAVFGIRSCYQTVPIYLVLPDSANHGYRAIEWQLLEPAEQVLGKLYLGGGKGFAS